MPSTNCEPDPVDASELGGGDGSNQDIIDALQNLNVNVDSINIDELDVSASGLTSVRRCTADGEIDIIICKEEDHDGQGVDSDDGAVTAQVVGWVNTEGVFVPGDALPDILTHEDATASPHTAFEGVTIAGPAVYQFPAQLGAFVESLTITGSFSAGVDAVVNQQILFAEYVGPSGSTLKLRNGQSHIWRAGEDTPASIGTLTIPAGFEVDIVTTEPDLSTI